MAQGRGVVVQAARFELIDGEGRVRAVLGAHPSSEDDEVVGLAIRDRAGSERAWVLTTGDGGAEVGVAHAGNVVALVRVTGAGVGSVTVFDRSTRVIGAIPA